MHAQQMSVRCFHRGNRGLHRIAFVGMHHIAGFESEIKPGGDRKHSFLKLIIVAAASSSGRTKAIRFDVFVAAIIEKFDCEKFAVAGRYIGTDV